LNNNYKQRFERNQVNEKIVTNSNSWTIEQLREELETFETSQEIEQLSN
jgi:hypothetical protein